MRGVLLSALLSAAQVFAANREARVASLNLDKKSGADLIAKMAADADLRKADVILLQEVVDSPRFHVASEAAKAFGMHFIFGKAFTLRGDTDEGLAILSRYAIGPHKIVPLERNTLHFKNRIRIALASEIAMPWGETQVICIHQDNRLNTDAKLRQLNDVWPAIRAQGPAILGGDFNSGNFFWVSHVIPIPEAQQQRKAVIEDAKKHGFITNLGSGPATYHIPGQKIDWIFVRDLKPLDSGVTPIHFSDHNSVWMTMAAR